MGVVHIHTHTIRRWYTRIWYEYTYSCISLVISYFTSYTKYLTTWYWTYVQIPRLGGLAILAH